MICIFTGTHPDYILIEMLLHPLDHLGESFPPNTINWVQTLPVRVEHTVRRLSAYHFYNAPRPAIGSDVIIFIDIFGGVQPFSEAILQVRRQIKRAIRTIAGHALGSALFECTAKETRHRPPMESIPFSKVE